MAENARADDQIGAVPLEGPEQEWHFLGVVAEVRVQEDHDVGSHPPEMVDPPQAGGTVSGAWLEQDRGALGPRRVRGTVGAGVVHHHDFLDPVGRDGAENERQRSLLVAGGYEDGNAHGRDCSPSGWSGF